MPRMTFTQDNKVSTGFDYPTLKLEMNERARILAIEPEPEVEFVHTLRAPRVTDGRVEYEEIKQRSGEYVRVPKMDFIGRHICPGSFDLLSQSGKDVKGCPTCQKAEKSGVVSPAERRFAMHVIRYQLQPGGFNVAEPFGVSLVAWVFGDRMFNLIVDFTDEWGDLRKHDLKLGPCTNPKYQKWEIQPAMDAAWLGNEDRQRVTTETYKSNQCPDLSRLIGRKLTMDQIMQDLEKVESAHREAFGGDEERAEPAAEVRQKDVNVTDLFDTKPATSPEPEPAAVTRPPREDTIDFDSLLKDL